MKSQFFTDTQALDAAPPPGNQICICLRMPRKTYEQAVEAACRLRMTSGEYIARLILSAGDTKALPPPDSPWPPPPPAPPDH